MVHTFFVISLIMSLVSYFLGTILTPFCRKKYTHEVFNEYNWVDFVRGVCGLVFIPSVLVAVVTGPLHYLGEVA